MRVWSVTVPASNPFAMSVRFLRILVLFLGLTGPLAAADQPIGQLLEQVEQASHQLDFVGTLVYRHGDTMQTLRLVHQGARDDRPERERLVTLDGEPREVIREGNRVVCLTPGDQPLVMHHSSSLDSTLPMLQSNLEQLREHYHIAVTGNERIQGRSAQRLAIEPRDDYRFGRYLWIDQESKLLLRSELRDREGNTLEQMAITGLDFPDSIDPEQLGSHRLAELEQPEAGATVVAKTPVSAPEWFFEPTLLLPGFTEQPAQHRRMPMNNGMVEHIVVSDGLAKVSVYLGAASEPGPAPTVMPERLGAVSSYVREIDGYRVTVVGEVPAVTVKRIGDALSIARAAQ